MKIVGLGRHHRRANAPRGRSVALLPLPAQADAMRDRQQFAAAAELYERALAVGPGNAGLHVQCGNMNKEIGRLALAEAHYRVAEYLTPEDADLHLQLGHVLKLAHRRSEARASYAMAASLRRDWPLPKSELENLDLSKGDAGLGVMSDEEIKAYEDMIAHYRRLMLRLLPSSLSPASSRKWRRLMPWLPGRSDQSLAVLGHEGDLMRDQKRYAEAAVLYEAALIGRTGPPSLHVQAGHMNKEVGRFRVAEAHYRAAEKEMPEDADLQLQLGHFYKISGRLDKAAIAYERAASLQSDWQEPVIELASVRERLARPPQADSSIDAPVSFAFSPALLASAFSSGEWEAAASGAPWTAIVSAAPGNRLEELFDAEFYRRSYPDVDTSRQGPLNEYLEEGWHAGRDPNPMFDGAFYLEQYRDAAATKMNPLLHYILFGQFEGKNPHPLFDTSYYLYVNRDVRASGFNPLFHFLSGGHREGRNPHPLFNISYYSTKYSIPLTENVVEHYLNAGADMGYNPHPLFFTLWYADKVESPLNPLVHYVLTGRQEGHSPNPLFDSAFYLGRYADACLPDTDPLTHYITRGWLERRDPHPLFDTAYYLAQDPSLEPRGINPLAHYIEQGYREDRAPSPLFDPAFYRSVCPAAAWSGNPLLHYVEHGAAHGLGTTPLSWLSDLLDQQDAEGNASPDVRLNSLTRLREILDPPGRAPEFAPGPGVMSLCAPLNIHALPSSKSPPRLNILLPIAGMSSTSGGPNTVLNLGFRLAAMGVAIRIISTDGTADADPRPYLEHARRLAGASLNQHVDIVLADGADRSRVVYIGEDDQFLASAWWTAQMIKWATRQTRCKRFFYMIQDYEPLLHESSSLSAMAEETYALDMIPVINTGLLFEFLRSRGIGRFGEPAFASTALVFDPAVDREQFHAVPREPGRKRQLLFYARPTTGRRNLFEMGVAVLRKLVGDGVVSAREWDFIGMGEAFAPVNLGAGAWLTAAPWLSFSDYAELMRESDILLSLMLSPHPSYPPIEMAACGRLAVTTEFGNKTAAALRAISPNIIAVPPTVEALAAAMAIAFSRLEADPSHPTAMSYPANWDESLSPIASQIFDKLLEQMGSPIVTGLDGGSVPAVGFRRWPTDPAALTKFEHQRRRGVPWPGIPGQGAPTAPTAAADAADGGVLSFVTTVWNTDPAYFQPLAESLLTQDCQGFEWVLLDNGSAREDTRALIDTLSEHPSVRVYRVEENLGIIRGMRYVLERATRRYVVPLDSDDVLTPDCVRVVTTALRRAGWPKLAYTDEDKIVGDDYLDAYCKPDWDPVLFFHSCYIAHLCCIDREAALSLGTYDDPDTNGSHDWDTFTRFHIAGHVPLHIPEVLYSWRMHQASTAANITSKGYITSSHRKVLGRLIAAQPDAARYSLVTSPLFGASVDWRFVRAAPDECPLLEVVLDTAVDWSALATRAAEAAGRLVHLIATDVVIDDQEWRTEAHTLMGLFPDVGVVGGRLHRHGRIVAADTYFQLGDGCASPNVGRLLADAGFFAQAWKPHSCDAVPSRHCVVRADLLAATASRLVSTCATFESLGLWLGRVAAERSLRVVYSPFVSASLLEDESALPSVAERRAQMLIQASAGGGRAWPPALGRTPATAFSLVPAAVARREAAALRMVADHAGGDAAAALLARRVIASRALSKRTLSVLTSVWAKTDTDLFEVTIRSVLEQTAAPDEWVILRNGPVPETVDAILERLAGDRRVNLVSVPVNIGIIGAVRFCLDHARCDVVVPMDADDVLVEDAFDMLLRGFDDPAVDLVYTDEDILQGDRVIARIRRTAFDPILNAADSTIWHLCGFSRARAIELNVYGDDAAEFCHDWDTVSRFADAGCRIEHVPAVLYHWRVHQTSSSNSGDLNQGSLRSVRFVLQRTIDRQANPELYEIAPFPISRGVEQLALLRRPILPMTVTLVVLSTGLFGRPVVAPFLPEGTEHVVVRDAFAGGAVERLRQVLLTVRTELVCVLSEGCVPEAGGTWEAMRLFELHGDVTLAAGRLYRADGTVVEACSTDASGAVNPWAGRLFTDPGEAALALKPQTASMIPNDYFFARTGRLRRTAAAMKSDSSLAEFGRAAAEGAVAARERIAYSPLIQARVVAHRRMITDPTKPVYPGLPSIPNAGEAAVAPAQQGVAVGTILWPQDWEEVGPQPDIQIAADFMGKLSVAIYTLADYQASGGGGEGTLARDAVAIPARVRKLSFVSPSFTVTPLEPLRLGEYVIQVRDRQNRAVSTAGFLASESPEQRRRVLNDIVGWRDTSIVVAKAKDDANKNPRFSIISTVYDTPLPFLEVVANSILAQSWTDFEWMVLDNGSKKPEVVRFLAALTERDSRIRVFRVDQNIHIIPGNRYLLERAAGRFIVPVDSDDIVYPDALERFASYGRQFGEPDLIYSDEVKIDVDGEPRELLWRTAPSRLLALSTCPASHLMAFDRQRALRAGVYTDDYAKGSHDWDTYLRLVDTGAMPMRLPEVLYAWRMHEASSAMSSGAKDYLLRSQLDVVKHSLARRKLSAFSVLHAARQEIGYYHMARSKTALPPIRLCIVVAEDDAHTLRQVAAIVAAADYRPMRINICVPKSGPNRRMLLRTYPDAVLVCEKPTAVADVLLAEASGEEFTFIIDSRLTPDNPDWLRDAVATCELDPAVGIVGGLIRGNDETLLHCGYVAGLDGFLESPHLGAKVDFAANSIRRTILATYGGFLGVRTEVVRAIGWLRGIDGNGGLNGLEFSLRARRAGIETAFCPTFSAKRPLPLLPLNQIEDTLQLEVRQTYSDLLAVDPYYSRHLSRISAQYGRPVAVA